MFRKLSIAAGLLIVIFAIFSALAIVNLNAIANANKAKFLALAEAEIGRRVSVGSLGVSFAGDISLRARNLTLEDDPAFSAEPFARIGELRLTARFFPLLWKELRIKRVTITQPSVRLIRDRRGKFNFDSLGVNRDERAAVDNTQDKGPSRAGATKPRRRVLPPFLAVGKISAGAIRYVDRMRHLDLAVSSLDLDLKPADAEGRFAVEISAAILSEKKNSKAAGKVGPIVIGAPLAEVPIEARLELGALHVATLSKNFPGLLTVLPQGLQLHGRLQLEEAAVKGTLKTFVAKLALNADHSEIQWRNEFFKAAGVPLRAIFAAQVSEDLIELRKSELQLRDLSFTASGMIPLRRLGDVDIAFETNQFAVGGWEKLFPVLETYRLSGQTQISGKVQAARKDGVLRDLDLALKIPSLAATLPQWRRTVSLAKASLRLSATRDDRLAKGKSVAPLPSWLPAAPAYNFTAADMVLSPVTSDAQKGTFAERLEDVESEGEITVAGGTIGYRGQVSASAGELFKIKLKELSTRLTLADRTLQVSGLKFAALQGGLKADGEYRFAGDTPSFRLSSQIDGIDIGQFARAVLGAEPRRLRGRLKLDMTLSGTGREWQDIRPSLHGQGSALVSRGALLNFNLAQQVLRKVTGVAGVSSLVPRSVRERYPRIFTARDTEFDELKGAFALANETAQLKDVVLSAPDFGAKGEGRIDFAGRLDFRGALLLSRQMTGDLTHAVGAVRYLTGEDDRVTLPFTAAGVMPRVEARPELPDIVKKLGSGILQRGLEGLTNRQPAMPQDPSEQPDRKEEMSPAEKLIRKGLEWLQRH